MSWSKCCYLYHKERGGIFLGDAREAELILDHVGRPLTVNQYLPEGRYGVSRIQACVMVDLSGDFEMTISVKKRGGGILSLLEEGFFDAELGRRVNTNDEEFARKIMADPDLRAALLSCPDKNIEIYPGPGDTHMLRVYVLSPERLGSTWPICAVDSDYELPIRNEVEIREMFFPPFERLLNVTRRVHDAVIRGKFA